MKEKQNRRQLTAEEKLKILEEARQDNVSLTHVCRKYGITLSQFYQWEKQARAAILIALSGNKRGRKETSKFTEMEAEINRLKEVIVEISASNIELKKRL
jgi:transposase